MKFKLTCSDRDSPASAIVVSMFLEPTGRCKLQFQVECNLQDLTIPETLDPIRQDGLWQHTCFELFVAQPDERYYEVNFSPSTQWAVYHFDAYREGVSRPELQSPPVIGVKIAQDSLVFDAALDLQGLLQPESIVHSRIALAAVLESRDGQLSYWALAHPPGKPDFHHPDSFVTLQSENFA